MNRYFWRSFSVLFLLLTASLFADPWGEDRDLQTPLSGRIWTDWVLQDSGKNLSEVFCSADSAETESDMVRKVAGDIAAFDAPAAEPITAELNKLTAGAVPASDPRWTELYRTAAETRRRFRLEEAAEETPVFVYVKHYVMGASHYAYTEDVSDEEYRDISCDRKPGGQLCMLTILPDGTTKSKVLYEVSDGTIRDPDVSYDGKRILFSMRTSYTEDDFHLYEYSLETGDVRQLTFGDGVADIEPAYLPNGDIVFDSTRCIQLTDCWWTEVSNIFMCDGEGRFIRRVTFDQVTVNYPKPLSDGRILYTRWDYNDRGHIYPQPLFVMNADGTAQTEFYGNSSFFPTAALHARGIPNSGSKAVAIAGGHHAYQHGKLILIDRTKGTQENEGAVLIAPQRETPADRIDSYGQEGELFAYPYPLNENEYIVTYAPEGRANKYKIPFGIYYFDIDGNRELLAFDPAVSCSQPVMLAERELPPARPSDVDYSKSTGKYYVQDVYEGPGLDGIERGKIKSIRIVSLLYRSSGIGWNYNWGEIVSSNVSTPVSLNGTWDAKKVIGEVPVESDGSAFFEVPARTPVYFQLLDENHDVVQTMRSWSTLQPGELFGCVGCHEPKDNIMANTSNQASEALQRPASVPQNFYEPGEGLYQNAGFSFIRDIQPILDRACVKCHNGNSGTPEPNLTGDVSPHVPHYMQGERDFSEAYVQLTEGGYKNKKYVDWPDIQCPPYLAKAPMAGAAGSPMMILLRDPNNETHKNIGLSETEMRKLALWIDLFVPFCGAYDEANRWTADEKIKYAYYEAKRKASFDVIDANIAILVESAGKEAPPLSEFPQFSFGGPSFKEKFWNDYRNRKIPVVTQKSDAENVYRNMACNPDDTQGTEPVSYPHAWTNSESGYLGENAACNAIDGKNDAKAWRPNYRHDAFLQIDFGAPAEVDRVLISFDLSAPDSEAWLSGTLVFSDGSEVDLSFDPNTEKQSFVFEKRIADSVRLTNLKSNRFAVPKGIAEFEVYGKN